MFGAKAYYSLDEMLADPEIDAVAITTPNHLHVEAVLACAAAGKHVLVEKPPAMKLSDVDAMVEACRKAGVRFGCTVQCRVRPAVQAIKQALDQGRFGRILMADAYMKWFRPAEYYKSSAWREMREAGAGVTVQQAFHYIDLLHYLAGEVGEVQARMENINHPGVPVEDTVSAFMTYKSGAKGALQASTALWPGLDVRLEINGENGTAVLVGERIATWKFRDERPEDAEVLKIGSSAQSTGATGAADLGHRDHMIVVQDLVDAVRENREVAIPVASVRHSLEICLGMYYSDKLMTPVKLPLEDESAVW